MHNVKTAPTIAKVRELLAHPPHPLGLVPTMGFLHEGHLTLVRQARAENRTVAVSIFVNPTQFGPAEDFARYPRNTERDLALLADEGVDVVFVPNVEEMYPPGFDTQITVGGVSEGLEGAARPGHFTGVATVVSKLFNIVQPDRAYFGQKDAQQLAVIRKMVADLNIAVQVVAVPTVRANDGLALSSRNVLLSDEERRAAPVLFQALRCAQAAYGAGERSGAALRQAMLHVLAAEPLAKPEYVSVAAAATLWELDHVEPPALLSLAVRFGNTRLIDNLPLE